MHKTFLRGVLLLGLPVCHAHLDAQHPLALPHADHYNEDLGPLDLDSPITTLKFSAPANGKQCTAQNTQYAFTNAELTDALEMAEACYDWNQGRVPKAPTCCEMSPGPNPTIRDDCCKYVRAKPPPKGYPSKFDNMGNKFPVQRPPNPKGQWPKSLWEFPLQPGSPTAWCGGAPGAVRLIMNDNYDYVGILVHDKEFVHPGYQGFVECV
ncbi:uncharacterized protein B0I36DRAFT_359961 [Microdochium trichocladiopsis]|uniref:Uncharacterized protein n=1 Tax=Microdochium trichocladiopsis TaxID=1682393 RepID=A0A9P8YHR5_9PEZI|nr:uncharacterized protein B0I36DRAFT_359961 [Microdochium trichocladiopsis]KAH7038385.1 hypothetical protein B0I36DRAFT_359961 [Microdochium trichocladiopsis]